MLSALLSPGWVWTDDEHDLTVSQGLYETCGGSGLHAESSSRCPELQLRLDPSSTIGKLVAWARLSVSPLLQSGSGTHVPVVGDHSVGALQRYTSTLYPHCLGG